MLIPSVFLLWPSPMPLVWRYLLVVVLTVPDYTKRKRGILPLLALLFRSSETSQINKQNLTPTLSVYIALAKVCSGGNTYPRHTNEQHNLYLPVVSTSALSLICALEFPTFKENKANALANTFSICSASLALDYVPPPLFTGQAQRGSGLRVRSYNNFLKQHHFL